MAKPPKNPLHPGEILLEEFLVPAGITQSASAEKVGWTRDSTAVVAKCREMRSFVGAHCYQSCYLGPGQPSN